MSLYKSLRCRHFDDRGRPHRPGCPRPATCRFAHPEDRQWATAGPSRHGGAGRPSPARTVVSVDSPRFRMSPSLRPGPRAPRTRSPSLAQGRRLPLPLPLPSQSELFHRCKVEDDENDVSLASRLSVRLDYGSADDDRSAARPGPTRGREVSRNPVRRRRPSNGDPFLTASAMAPPGRGRVDRPARAGSERRTARPFSVLEIGAEASRSTEHVATDAPVIPAAHPDTGPGSACASSTKANGSIIPSVASKDAIELILASFRDIARNTHIITRSTVALHDTVFKLEQFANLSSKLPISESTSKALSVAIAPLLAERAKHEQLVHDSEENAQKQWEGVFKTFIGGVIEGVEQSLGGVIVNMERRVKDSEENFARILRSAEKSREVLETAAKNDRQNRAGKRMYSGLDTEQAQNMDGFAGVQLENREVSKRRRIEDSPGRRSVPSISASRESASERETRTLVDQMKAMVDDQARMLENLRRENHELRSGQHLPPSLDSPGRTAYARCKDDANMSSKPSPSLPSLSYSLSAGSTSSTTSYPALASTESLSEPTIPFVYTGQALELGGASHHTWEEGQIDIIRNMLTALYKAPLNPTDPTASNSAILRDR
ncbi:hypothetical protein PUNSTDRAFT_136102 [Punctularia strigosozonata HHB-11173 SS5]|uniref:uncharacterized protein n=1 Tax=Punctularia strigosozonata (strain HHB-11173) TaxID=741275 RepID=UPI00044186B7|nr:uncharacterized protein PUNSTDRAFT_136102 [Punctularia strigosozonata HHB-11173 SS5]EIN07421.1 hypothetical protein PUNSTDRAFT_136102 [Punctularia strigosozonata HHB-11173 SS5]